MAKFQLVFTLSIRMTRIVSDQLELWARKKQYLSPHWSMSEPFSVVSLVQFGNPMQTGRPQMPPSRHLPSPSAAEPTDEAEVARLKGGARNGNTQPYLPTAFTASASHHSIHRTPTTSVPPCNTQSLKCQTVLCVAGDGSSGYRMTAVTDCPLSSSRVCFL